jgi:Flp pilus assembly protein TadD
VAGAVACFTKALTLDPKLVQAHYNLGTVLHEQGDLKEAMACYRKALEVDPKHILAHNNLGLALYQQGDLAGAIACFRKALALNPKDAEAHTNLGLALQDQGDVKGAIACYRQALDLDPKLAQAHNNLGNTLRAQGDLKGAITHLQKALDLNPKYAEAHCNLGHALRRQGHFAPALQALKRGHQLGSQRPNWRYPSARWVEDCQRLLDLDTRLPAVLKGEDQPKDAAEQLALADLCRRYRKRYAAAARFYSDAFAGDPKLTFAQQAFCRYNAACAAALAGGGQGTDADKLEAKEKTRLRQQALSWLRDSLQHYAKQLETADAKTRATLQQTLRYWQQDPDLAGLRDEKAMAKLPEAERQAWQKLWADVAALLKRAAGQK